TSPGGCSDVCRGPDRVRAWTGAGPPPDVVTTSTLRGRVYVRLPRTGSSYSSATYRNAGPSTLRSSRSAGSLADGSRPSSARRFQNAQQRPTSVLDRNEIPNGRDPSARTRARTCSATVVVRA